MDNLCLIFHVGAFRSYSITHKYIDR